MKGRIFIKQSSPFMCLGLLAESETESIIQPFHLTNG